MGHTDDPKHCMVKLFCPKCQDVYSCAPNQRRMYYLQPSLLPYFLSLFFHKRIIQPGEADLQPFASVETFSLLFLVFFFFELPSDLYPMSSFFFTDIDGAFFGPTFPNLFFMTYEDIVPEPVAEQVNFYFVFILLSLASSQKIDFFLIIFLKTLHQGILT